MKFNSHPRKRRWPYIVGGILVLLIAFRLILPYIVLKYVNKTLADLKGYSGHVEDIDISLLRGAYKIRNMKIVKTDGKVPVPFFSTDVIDLSVEWKALLNASLVGEIEVMNPKLNFVAGPTKASSQTGMNNDWKDQVKKLFPLKINRFEIFNGEVHYRDFNSKPDVNIYIKDIHALATNLTNSEKLSETLSADIKATGTAMNSGKFSMKVTLDPYSDKPTFNLDAKLEHLQAKELNKFILAYGKFDVQEGTLGLYIEAAAKNGKVTGYAKPLIKDLNVLKPKEEDHGPIRFLYEAAVEGIAEVFENQPHDRIATKVAFSGSYDNPDINIWFVVGNLLRNAFVKVLLPQIDNSITMSDVGNKNDKEAKKEDKKQEKEKKKEEKQEKKEQKKKEKEQEKKAEG